MGEGDGKWNVYVFGYPAKGLPSYEYSFCWGRAPGLDPFLYSGRIGAFVISGPYTNDYGCTMGVPCILATPGVALMPTNKITIISAGVCGKTNMRIESEFVGVPNPVPSSYGSPYQYEPGTIVDGKPTADGYSVCWGHDPQTKFDYSLYLGFFGLDGPGRGGQYTSQVGHAKCPRGMLCTIEFYGIGLLPINGVVLIERDGDCGDANPVLAQGL